MTQKSTPAVQTRAFIKRPLATGALRSPSASASCLPTSMASISTTRLSKLPSSRLLKVLEKETEATIQRELFAKQRALPDLADNIKCGNSLIGPNFYVGQQRDLFTDEDRLRINAFDWR